MATVPPIKVPVELLGLKCLFCIDKSLEASPPKPVNDAVTLQPWAQTFTVMGQTIVGVCAVPVCLGCRSEQIGRPSSNGRLLTA